MSRVAPLAALLLGGCYLSHGVDGRPARDAAPPSRDAAIVRDASVPRVDARVGRDAMPPSRDAGRDASAPLLDGGTGCVLPVEPFPERDVCRPETGDCIESCGTSQLCIIACLQRDEPCRICAVRNALSCFNEETECRAFYPGVSCCIVEECGADVIDDVLNVCTALACEEVFTEYANCAIARARLRCRAAVAECGLPPNLLGLD